MMFKTFIITGKIQKINISCCFIIDFVIEYKIISYNVLCFKEGMISLIYSLSELREKEVINVINGEKLGFIDDIEFEAVKGEIIAFVIYGRKRLYGLLGKDNDLIITCSQIKLIGSDTILVSFNKENCEKKTKISKFKLENLLK